MACGMRWTQRIIDFHRMHHLRDIRFGRIPASDTLVIRKGGGPLSGSTLKDAWRAWLRANFGASISPQLLETAVEEGEVFRGMWGDTYDFPLDNKEMPFPNPMKPADPTEEA